MTRLSLLPSDVQAYVFWSRNFQPFLDRNILERLNKPFTCHLTITGYGRSLDKATISPEKAIDQVRKIRDRFSMRHVVWRYDPIVISKEYSPDWHLENFKALALALKGTVDEVIVSFLQFYQKNRRNFSLEGFEPIELGMLEKQRLLQKLAKIATDVGDMRLTLCAQPELMCEGIGESACIDLERLNSLATRPLSVSHKPHRPKCGCATSFDIGAYDSCPHGCLYCYAVHNRDLAKERFQKHDPKSPYLFAPKEEVQTKDDQPLLI